eukprot:COSAG01_NODE_107_length_25964_cov_174.577576_13_plen_63_part_00
MAPHLQRGVSEKVLLVSALMSEIHSPTHGGILVTSKLGVASVHNMKFLLLALKSGSADLLIE